MSGVPSGDKLGLSHTVISPVLDTLSALGVTGFMDMSACILYVPMDKEYRAHLLQVHHHPSSSHCWSLKAEHFFYPSNKPRFLPEAQSKSLRSGRNKQNPLRVSPDAEPRCGRVASCCTSMQTCNNAQFCEERGVNHSDLRDLTLTICTVLQPSSSGICPSRGREMWML